jgi:hypothetical protein
MPFTESLNAMNPTQRMLVGSGFNVNPDQGMQYYIDQGRPSNQMTEMLRRILPQLVSQWGTSQIMNPNSGDFASFLGGYDFNKAFARVNPQQRNERSQAFNRPGVRTVQF